MANEDVILDQTDVRPSSQLVAEQLGIVTNIVVLGSWLLDLVLPPNSEMCVVAFGKLIRIATKRARHHKLPFFSAR